MAIKQTNTTMSINVNEVESYILKNSNGFEILEKTFAPSTKLFTFSEDLSGCTLNAYMKKINYPNAFAEIVGTASGDVADTDIELIIYTDTILGTYGTGKYRFELWAEYVGEPENMYVLLYPQNPQQSITVNIVDRIMNDLEEA